MDPFFLMIDLLVSSLLINKRISICSHSHFFSYIRDMYPYEHPWFYSREHSHSYCSFVQILPTERGWLIFVKYSSPILNPLPLMPIEMKATLFIDVWWLRCSTTFVRWILSYVQLFNWGTSYGRAEQFWSFQAVYSRWNQCFLPTHIVHNDFRADLGQSELCSEHHDVICRLEGKPSLIGILCSLSNLVACIQLSPVTAPSNCVSDHHVIVS